MPKNNRKKKGFKKKGKNNKNNFQKNKKNKQKNKQRKHDKQKHRKKKHNNHNNNHNNYNNYNNGYNDRNKFERYNSHSDLFASIQNQATQNAQQQIEAIRNGNLGYGGNGFARMPSVQTRSMCKGYNGGFGEWTW